jgi:hypothetical protein
MTFTFDSIAAAHEYANSAVGGVHMYINKAGYTQLHEHRVECFNYPRAAALNALQGTTLAALTNDYAVLTVVDKAGKHFYAAAAGTPLGFTHVGEKGLLLFLNDNVLAGECRHEHIKQLKQDT